MPQEFFLTTVDDVLIFGSWLEAAADSKVALLLHQRGRDHAMWEGFRLRLAQARWSTLAIDLRGHGRSEGPPPEKTRRFDQFSDYHTMLFDVAAAVEFICLRSQKGYLVGIGSSIGANIMLTYAADHFELRALALLSPGLDYFGLRTDDVMIQYHRPLALVTAKDDPFSTDTQKLIKLPGVGRPNLWYREYESGGHGVKLFETHPELMEQLAEWLEKSAAA